MNLGIWARVVGLRAVGDGKRGLGIEGAGGLVRLDWTFPRAALFRAIRAREEGRNRVGLPLCGRSPAGIVLAVDTLREVASCALPCPARRIPVPHSTRGGHGEQCTRPAADWSL